MTDTETADLCNKIRVDLADITAEMDYLRWFKNNADFGPADEDVHDLMNSTYTLVTGKPVPKDWA
jgi:hypothetical protein